MNANHPLPIPAVTGAQTQARLKISRREGARRIQVGLSGLVGVLVLVGLANVVVDNVRREEGKKDAAMESAANATSQSASGGTSSEPLAELGVAPAADNGDQQPVVADLQPDPNLKEPMDRPPPVTPTINPQPRPATQN